jgi:hypothetical protein
VLCINHKNRLAHDWALGDAALNTKHEDVSAMYIEDPSRRF